MAPTQVFNEGLLPSRGTLAAMHRHSWREEDG
jgi:hypothetical protein